MIHTSHLNSRQAALIARLNNDLAAGRCTEIVELGCGMGAVIVGINKKGRKITGVEVFEPYVDVARQKHKGVEFICADIRNVRELFEPKSFDAVVFFDILEHLEFLEATCLLEDAEKIARKRIIAFVPTGNHPQTEEPNSLYRIWAGPSSGREPNHHYQTHRSTWQPEHLDHLGYNVWNYPNYAPDRPNKGKSAGAMYGIKVIRDV